MVEAAAEALTKALYGAIVIFVGAVAVFGPIFLVIAIVERRLFSKAALEASRQQSESASDIPE